jgi:lysozyme family protein
VCTEYVGQVAWHVQKLKEGRLNYERVGALAKVPWYFIGIVHGLEASFHFSGHLHNGDPLSTRTVHVPAGRPQVSAE